MHTVAAHAHQNRMTASAVAACMAPLLLRPLLAGECELDDDFDINGDSSAQLLAAANAANNAQAIINTLLEEYTNIFDVRFSQVYLFHIIYLVCHFLHLFWVFWFSGIVLAISVIFYFVSIFMFSSALIYKSP